MNEALFKMIPYHIICVATIALLCVASKASEAENDGFCKKSGEDDCGQATENKFRKTALITGGSGFVAHHVIEVTNGGCILLFVEIAF